ncbi:MAG TPA: ATP-dependent Clp protease adaptor ClpS [Flavisolibacter sp.]|nr:ATP-dependent Clp protease adaptor ClpS [Flavisolibacter sp.]
MAIFVAAMNTATETDVLELVDTKTVTTNPYQLVVWNDDVNTFEWVIETLVEVCGHTQEQAEQCAYIIHFNGKYAVKEGSYKDLRPKCDAILDRGISATIEVTA